MPNTTKQALEESLKHMLLKKPLDKITIRDITEDCGISRMAFYYHFKDIYDLVEWACIEDASKALQGKKTYETWQEGLLQIFEAVLENKPFILNAYRCISREQMERFLYQLTYGLIRGVVDEQSQGTAITEEDKSFTILLYFRFPAPASPALSHTTSPPCASSPLRLWRWPDSWSHRGGISCTSKIANLRTNHLPQRASSCIISIEK